MRLVFLFFWLVFFVRTIEPLVAETIPAQSEIDFSKPGPHLVGHLEFPDLRDAKRNRSVPIKVHYPKIATKAPLIIFSHGGGGNWEANFAQSEHLASYGYVVFAPEHVGSNTEVFKRGFRFKKNLEAMTRDANEVLTRPLDVSFAIDQAEIWNKEHSELSGRIDLEKIGVAGHSYGAYTALVISGARTALQWLVPAQSRDSELGPDLSESRVDCAVALSPQPANEPLFNESSFKTIKIPVLGITGTKDRPQVGEPSNRLKAFRLWPPGDKYFLWLNKADHTAFSDSTGSGRRMLISASREDAQPISKVATLMFFRSCLGQEQREGEFLNESQLRGYLRGKVDSFELFKK